MQRLIVFDFDGTLCLGDDPVLTYAQFVDDALRRRGSAGKVRETVQRGLESGNLMVDEIALDGAGYPIDIADKTDMVLWPLQDGYQLVQLLGLQAGLPIEDIHAAFRDSRVQLLGTGLAASDVHAPHGAAELIATLRQGSAVVLITNSPAEHFDVWLSQLGLTGAFDLVINSAQKPAGMPAAVEQARAVLSSSASPIPMEAVVSIGDIWGNDLAYVHEQGGTTVLIDRFGTGLGSPDVRKPDAERALRALNDEQVTST